MPKLFGTDGIRGIVGKPPLTKEDLYRVSRLAARLLIAKRKRSSVRVLLIRDTRASGAVLARSIAEGFVKEGTLVFDGGVLPTPSLACLVPRRHLDGGIVVSASHNPPEYNGVKFVTPEGTKWPDVWERAVERSFSRALVLPRPRGRIGDVVRDETAAADYLEFLKSTFPKGLDLSGMRLVVDCAHGATFELAPRLLASLGARVTITGNRPSGKNINVGCGSQHPQLFLDLIKKFRADAGIAFDGDGDRVVFGDERGRLCDGDHLLGILAQHLKKRDLLDGHTIVITVMANWGLRKALDASGIHWVETAVGDRYVSDAMRKHHAVLGGEQSGHIILNQYLNMGDGMLTALQVLAILGRSGQRFSQLAHCVRKVPQVLVNVPVRRKPPIARIADLKKAISKVERALLDRGRVLVRYSGTEPSLRIMLEGPRQAMLEHYAHGIAETASRLLG